MGLDMYLCAEMHTGKWFYPEHLDQAKALADAMGLVCEDEANPAYDIKTTALYWRKANAIHSWFVTNVQGGEDECKETYVSRKNLEDLLTECKATLKNKDNPDAISLQPVQGFFFGSTDMDEWYWQDIERTIKGLEKILGSELMHHASFTYQSSW